MNTQGRRNVENVILYVMTRSLEIWFRRTKIYRYAGGVLRELAWAKVYAINPRMRPTHIPLFSVFCNFAINTGYCHFQNTLHLFHYFVLLLSFHCC